MINRYGYAMRKKNTGMGNEFVPLDFALQQLPHNLITRLGCLQCNFLSWLEIFAILFLHNCNVKLHARSAKAKVVLCCLYSMCTFIGPNKIS